MTKLKIYNNGYYFYKNKEYHSIHDTPSCYNISINITWRENGRLHRLNGPAVIYSDGKMFWYENEKCIKVEQYKNDQT